MIITMTLLLMLVIIISCLYNYTNSYKNTIGLDRVIYSKVLMSTNQEVISSSSSS